MKQLLQPFSHGDIALTESIFLTSRNIGYNYVMWFDPDRLLAPCLEAQGLPPRKMRYGGWEARGIGGHTLGHWLTALSLLYAQTGDAEAKQKLDYSVAELARAQSADGYVGGFDKTPLEQAFRDPDGVEIDGFNLAGHWVPLYSLHKIFAGLLDAYRLAGINQALDICVRFADWVVRGISTLTESQMERLLACEHGGICETFADLHAVTGEMRYLETARRFAHKAIIEPLSKGADDLCGKHANTQIPKLIGAAKLYEYHDVALFFHHIVTHGHTYAIGGNSVKEHFCPPGDEPLDTQTCETCNTNNMLRLTGMLFCDTGVTSYMDYYETALYNHILGSQDPDSGEKTYFMSLKPGHMKVYSRKEDAFWCCVGTGMENPFRYVEHIWHHDEDKLYLSLFIPSRVSWRGVSIELETRFPYNDTILLSIAEGEGAFELRVRLPEWTREAVDARNGEVLQVKDGYIILDRLWKQGDKVAIRLPMSLAVYRTPNDPAQVAFRYGPVVLAAPLGCHDMPESDLVPEQTQLDDWPTPEIHMPELIAGNETHRIKPVEGSPLHFQIDDSEREPLELMPFFELHHQRYTVYFHCTY